MQHRVEKTDLKCNSNLSGRFSVLFYSLNLASDATETTLPPPGLCERIVMMTLHSNYTESIIHYIH